MYLYVLSSGGVSRENVRDDGRLQGASGDDEDEGEGRPGRRTPHVPQPTQVSGLVAEFSSRGMQASTPEGNGATALSSFLLEIMGGPPPNVPQRTQVFRPLV